MKMFRSTRDGGASVWLSAGEASLLRTLVVPVMELLTDPTRPSPAKSAEPADVLDDLEALFAEVETPNPDRPDDPVLARLLPDAYRDDEAKSGEFRKFTESSLRE